MTRIFIGYVCIPFMAIMLRMVIKIYIFLINDKLTIIKLREGGGGCHGLMVGIEAWLPKGLRFESHCHTLISREIKE